MIQQRNSYPSDIPDERWEVIKDDIPKCKSSKKYGGRPEKYTRREIVNAILYLVSSGCRYGDIPHDLPPQGITWKYFNRWRMVRKKRGRSEDPSMALIDSQTVKDTCFTEDSGYGAVKRPKGEKDIYSQIRKGLFLMWSFITQAYKSLAAAWKEGNLGDFEKYAKQLKMPFNG